MSGRFALERLRVMAEEVGKCAEECLGSEASPRKGTLARLRLLEFASAAKGFSRECGKEG